MNYEKMWKDLKASLYAKLNMLKDEKEKLDIYSPSYIIDSISNNENQITINKILIDMIHLEEDETLRLALEEIETLKESKNDE